MTQVQLDMFIIAADQSGVSLDVLLALCRDLDDMAIAKLCGNCASMPLYMKSKVAPNFSHSTMASSGSILR